MAYQKQTYQDGITEYTDTLFEHMDDGIFGAYPVQLIAISDTAPSQCVENDKYYNTSTKKIYTATGTNTWGTNGETPLEDTAYWLISENGSYAWNGTDLVSIGGGKAEVVISDEEPEEGKLWVDTTEIQTIAGRDRLVNVSNEVDEDYRVNLLETVNLFSKSNTIKAALNQGNGMLTSENNFLTIYFKCKPNTTYTFSKSVSSNRYVVGYSYEDDMTLPKQLHNVITSDTTFTTTIDTKIVFIMLSKTSEETSNINDILNSIMINEGSTALPYEPFIPNQIVVDNEKYTDTLNVGKFDSRSRVNVLHSKNLCNLLDTTKFNYRYKGTSPYYQSFIPIEILSNKIKVRPGGGNYTEGYIDIKGLKPNTKYSISYTILENTTNFNPTITISNSGVTDANGDITLNLLLNNGGTSSVTSTYVVYGNIQLEEGNTATTYEPYITPSIYVDGEEIYNFSEFAFFYKKIVKPTDSANFNYLLEDGTMGTIYINELNTTKYYIGTFNKVSGQNPVFNMIGNNGITITGYNASGTVVLSGATTNSNLRVCIIGCRMDFAI